MRRIEININGASYPCYQTAGAMLRFKDLTGREVSEIRGNQISELIKFLWCCTVSASKREQKEFPYGLMEFSDLLDMEQMEGWQSALDEQASEEGDEKKSPSG